YPAVALLTADFLERWRRGAVEPARWVMPASLAALGFVGVGITTGLLIAGGVIDVAVRRSYRFPGLEELAWVGAFPVLGAAAGTWLLIRHDRRGVVAGVAVSAVLLVAAVVCCGAPAFDAFKAPRALVAAAGARQPERDIRVGCYAYFQPSLVFYCQ